jgi:urate oxidase
LKSTGSAFHGFIRDEYTTLGETWDRILSTDVDATWEWRVFRDVEEVRKEQAQFDLAWEGARETTMRVFAEDYSASVQATMYKMSEEILEKVPDVMRVTYELPNKHYFEISKLYPGLKTMSENHSSIPQPKDEGTGFV